MTKAFASQGDLSEKKTSFTQIGDGIYAFTAEGDPNTGVIIGDDSVMVIDATATPVMAQDLIARIRRHPEPNRRLFMINDANDASLEHAYSHARALVFPSEVEGFGLPLVEAMQREHRVTLAGPTTLLATLNSLQMGFRTLAIQQRSSEVWGLLGTRYARFANFVRGPAAVARYLGAMLRGRPEHHVGHNPAGALAIVAMLALAAVGAGAAKRRKPQAA